jgi:hypothetical protein
LSADLTSAGLLRCGGINPPTRSLNPYRHIRRKAAFYPPIPGRRPIISYFGTKQYDISSFI